MIFTAGIDDSIKLWYNGCALILMLAIFTVLHSRYASNQYIPFLLLILVFMLCCIMLSATEIVPCHELWTIANAVTMLKIPVSFIGVHNARRFGKETLWLSVLCGWMMNLIDDLDGPIARSSGCTSASGNWLDHSVCDKIGEIYWFILCSVIFPKPRWIWDLVLIRTAITIEMGPWAPPMIGCIHWYASWTSTLWTLNETIKDNFPTQKWIRQYIGKKWRQRAIKIKRGISKLTQAYAALLLVTRRFDECA